MKYWSKSALSIYYFLECLAKKVDADVENIVEKSRLGYHSTFYQAEQVIELTDRKRKMINLKIAVEESLHKIPKIERRILCLVFIDKVKSELVAEILGLSLRTFFRRKNKALEDFKEQMISNGFDLNFFEQEYSQEDWFLSVYEENVMKYNKDEENLDPYIINRMMKEVSKIKIPKLSCY